jgi:protein N-terminal methyltransferase
MYLTDSDLLEFLVRSRDNLETSDEVNEKGIKKSGLLFVKENVNSEKFLVDREDNSIMRTNSHFEALFEEAGLQVLKQFY